MKKSTYFEPTTRTSLSAGLLLREEAPCDAEEVADEALAVEVALSLADATEIKAAVVEAANASVAIAADVEGVELALSGSTTASVSVALVDVAVKAATKSVLNAQTIRLVRRALAAEVFHTLG